MKKNHYAYYDLILAAFVLTLLVSNIAATKLVTAGPLILDGGAILFPLSYILGDILTEVYGYRFARRAIWSGFVGMIVAIVTFTVVGWMPFPPEYTAQSSYEAVLGFLPRIVLASLTAFVIGEFLNSYVLATLKVRMKGRKLWLRLIGSTIIGELFDTVIFCVIAFGGILGAGDMLNYILVGWLFKVGVEIVMLPLTYRVIAFLKHRECSDADDHRTNFTPLSMSLEK